jgi:membrane protein implicated in regulation of membrane protease activity
MRWAKVVMIALGALIAFIVIESVFRLLQWAIIALVIGVIIAIAVKANSQYKLARERRAQVRQEKAARKREVRVEDEPTREVAPVPVWTAERALPASSSSVDDELARLKREMGS